jgi:large subunit ribosomal protein L31
MKQGIHPKYYPNATVVCACGNTWQTGSTSEFIQTDVCSKCHPFYTGEQRIVDTEGQVDRFYKRLQAREEYISEQKERDAAQTSLDLSILELELGKRTEGTLTQAGIETVGQIIEKLALGDSALLEIDGFGRKSLADVKRSLKHRGYRLPEEAEKEAS